MINNKGFLSALPIKDHDFQKRTPLISLFWLWFIFLKRIIQPFLQIYLYK